MYVCIHTNMRMYVCIHTYVCINTHIYICYQHTGTDLLPADRGLQTRVISMIMISMISMTHVISMIMISMTSMTRMISMIGGCKPA